MVEFPNPENASPEGIVAVGGDLDTDTLLSAYQQGIFPWPIELGCDPTSGPIELGCDPTSGPIELGCDPTGTRRGRFALAWFCPPKRAILDFKKIHVPRSLAKTRRKKTYRFTLDQAFDQVIRHCAAAKRPGQRGTWITPEMVNAYGVLHRKGFAHSVEAWEGNKLVGGIYGVEVAGVFSGESMFHLKPNASKLALLHLVDLLAERGFSWMDIQVMTPHMAALGAQEITRAAFLSRLARARARACR